MVKVKTGLEWLEVEVKSIYLVTIFYQYYFTIYNWNFQMFLCPGWFGLKLISFYFLNVECEIQLS